MIQTAADGPSRKGDKIVARCGGYGFQGHTPQAATPPPHNGRRPVRWACRGRAPAPGRGRFRPVIRSRGLLRHFLDCRGVLEGHDAGKGDMEPEIDGLLRYRPPR